MADHAIGSRISLVSKAEIRYEGFLHFINPDENTVGLKDVRMLGTQGRRGGHGEVEPNSTVYDFIIFRGGDIKDLTVFDDNQQQEEVRNNEINDPAIMSSGAKAASNFNNAPSNNNNTNSRDRREDRRSDFGTQRQQGGGFYDRNREDTRFDRNREDTRFGGRGGYNDNRFDRRDDRGGYGGGYGGRGGSRIGGYEGGRGGRGGGFRDDRNHGYDRHRGDFDAPRPEYHTGRDFDVASGDKKEKLEAFDFAKANAEFEKHKAEFDKAREEVMKAQAGKTYDKSSFFDNISSESSDRKNGGMFGPRTDRDEQRRADVQTFGSEAVGNMRGFRRGRGGRGRFGRN